jgi:hypothetical protein
MPPRFNPASVIGLASGLAVVLVGAGLHAAEPPAVQLDLRAGLGLRDDRVSMRGVNVIAQGNTGSTLVARAAWFGSGARPGMAAHVSAEWFTLRGRDGELPAFPRTAIGASAVDAGAALALRASHRRLAFELQAGWNWLQLPVVQVKTAANGVALEGDRLRAHGPAIGAGVAARVIRGASLEATVEVMPVAFGADHAGGSVSPRRWDVGAVVALGPVPGAGAGWSILIGYARGRTSAPGDTLDIQQDHQHVGLGVRATWLPIAPPPVVATSAPPPEPAAGRLRLVVRERIAAGSSAGAVLPGVTIAVRTGGSTTAFVTDARGELVLRGFPAGPVQVQLGGAGWQPTSEIVAFPARGEASADLLVTRARPADGAPATSAITGLVRSESGTPVTANVRIVELNLERAVDDRGGFHFDLPPGNYTLIIEADGFVSQRKQIGAGSDEQQIYNIDLQPERR